jgi:hypothetical protein
MLTVGHDSLMINDEIDAIVQRGEKRVRMTELE